MQIGFITTQKEHEEATPSVPVFEQGVDYTCLGGGFMSNFINIHEFNGYLNNMIDERFPGTERYIVNGGDYVKDFIVELRKDGKTLRCCR